MPDNTETVLTVTYGAEKFAPVPYHVFDIGPFQATTTVKTGETIEEAYNRVYAQLEKIARVAYTTKLNTFLDRIRQAASSATVARLYPTLGILSGRNVYGGFCREYVGAYSSSVLSATPLVPAL